MRVAVVVTARPSWAKLAPVCRVLKARPAVELQIIVCASALLERYGRVRDVIAQEFEIAAECWSTYEGANLLTSAKETGALLTELSAVLFHMRADACVVCADRHEVLAAAQAAAYLHLPVVHLQGGERSGSIDDRVRDSITQLSDLHCVCTKRAALRVYALTGDYEAVTVTGCPSIDLAKAAQEAPPVTAQELGGAGASLDPEFPFVLILQHPVTNEMAQAGEQMRVTLEAVSAIDLPRLVLWSGQDAGSDAMSKAVRVWMADHPAESWHTLRNLPPARFLRLLTQCACLVGNSSAGIREASYLGVPVVNVGSRQQGRERAANVVETPHDVGHIVAALTCQIAHGTYRSSSLYGTGNAGERIADVITGARVARATA